MAVVAMALAGEAMTLAGAAMAVVAMALAGEAMTLAGEALTIGPAGIGPAGT